MDYKPKIIFYAPGIIFVRGGDILKEIFYFTKVIEQGLNTCAVRVMKETEVYILALF